MAQPPTLLALGRAALLLAAALPVSSSLAQTTPPPAGRVEQDIRRPPEPVPRPAIVVDRPRFAEQAPPGAERASFTLGSVVLAGNTAIPTADLAALWADRLGQPITLAEAFGIAAAVSARYREAGYVLSQALIPAQELATTAPVALRIDVLEGHVDRVSFTGIEGERLAAYLAPVRAERPLRLATLERSLLLIGELAGVSAQANLRAGATRGASDLEIVVLRSPREFSLAAHNRSAPSQGRIRFEAGASLRGVAGAFDRHDLRLVTSGDERLALLAYAGEVPIGASGLKGVLSASTSRSKPTSTVGNIDTRSDTVSIGLTYPVLRSRQASLGVRAHLTGYDNRSDTTAIRVSQDRIRALRMGLTADYADAVGGISLLDIEVAKGLSGLGASRAGDPLLLGAVPTFSKLTLYAARLQSLGANLSLLVAVTAQASGDKLPSAEQLGLGGETFLRAYDPSEVIGENGLAGKVELRSNLSFGAVESTLYAYVDSGQVRRKQVGAADQKASLSAAGIGVRASGPNRTKGYIEIAKPIHRVVASRGNTEPRLFAGVGIDF